MGIEETYLINDIDKNITPDILKGIIIMWSGAVADIPDGWVLCDGTNGTPDLRNRFVVGAGDSYAVGDIGGADAVTLTTDQIPTHTHTVASHIHSSNEVPTFNANTNALLDSSSYKYANESTNSVFVLSSTFYAADITLNLVGGGLAHENRPPYYALCYIMKI